MNELVKLENITALEVFTSDNAETLVSKIEGEVRSFIPDLETDKSRKEIASLSAKVSKSKVILDGLGKTLVSEWKNKAKVVDAERKMIRDRLDCLRDEARKPLTEWEDIEKKKIEDKRIAKELLEDHEQAITENDLFNRTREIERKEEDQRILEEAKLRKEREDKLESERIERENAIAIKAAEDEKRKAEDLAIKEKAAAEQQIIEAKAAVEMEKIKAKRVAEQAEKDKADAIVQAELRLIKEVQKKEQERVEEERKQRVESEKISAEAKRKADNKNHQKKINNHIINQLKAIGIDENLSKKLIISIVKKEIDYLSINY